MKVICAWCRRKLGEKAPLENPGETHTICAACREEFNREPRQEACHG